MRYIIVTPTYNERSAGIRVMHELQKWLIRSGKDAMILNFTAPYPIEDDDIVVYPEIVKGNPLGAKRVVRYLLNFPGVIGGDKEYDESEILVAYDPELGRLTNNFVLKIPCTEDFFRDCGYERTLDCYWVGKSKNSFHPELQNAVQITYAWPAKRRELAELLNMTRTLYTYDDRSALALEAMLCGCRVMLVKDQTITNITPPRSALEYKELPAQLANFIEKTWYPEIDLGHKALESVKAAISLDRNQNLTANGIQLKQDGQFEEALKIFGLAASAGEKSAMLHTGDCLVQMGRLGEAEGAYNEALSNKCDDNRAHIGLGIVYLSKKKLGSAISHFNLALRLDPDNTEALCGVGVARIAEGRPRIGHQYLIKAIHANPENTVALGQLAKCAIQLKSFTEAVELLSRHMESHPGDNDMRFTLAELLHEAGKYGEAFRQAALLLGTCPDYIGGQDLLTRIQKEIEASRKKSLPD
jgi:tetratricopeptide (TPR) repeat protein